MLSRNIDYTRSNWILRYGLAVIAVAIGTLLRFRLGSCCGVNPPFITFYPAVMLAALCAGGGTGVFATVLSMICADYFFIAPNAALAVAKIGDAVSIAVFVLMGLAMSAVAAEFDRIKHRDLARSDLEREDSESRFQTVVAGIKDYAIYALDAAGHVVSWNAGAERIEGWSATDVLGQHFSVFYPRDAVEQDKPNEHLALAVAQGAFAEEALRVRKDGSPFWAEVTLTALLDRQRPPKARGFVKIVHDVSARRRAAQDMAENRSQLASILESAMDALITIDTTQHIVLFNAAAVAMFRCPLEEALGQPLDRFIPQRYRAAHAAHIGTFAATGTSSRAMGNLGVLYGIRTTGEEFPIEASISQVENGGRKIFTVILRDITERKRAEERQSLLLREMAHRVKNTNAVVQSIAGQTRRFALPEQFDVTFSARLRALGHAHDLLTQSEWEGATLSDIVLFSLKPYEIRGQAERRTVAGPDVWLAPNPAVTLSLAFHELATNAAKFGALSNSSGRIDVRWGLTDDDPAAIEIKWRESGGPPVDPPSHKGFGSTLLERAVAHELAGTMELGFAREGLECTLHLPMSQHVQLRT